MVWRLLTNREAQDADAVIELVERYRARWEVGKFFHVLKTGCKVEALQLGSCGAGLGVDMVVAWRITRGRLARNWMRSCSLTPTKFWEHTCLPRRPAQRDTGHTQSDNSVGCFPGWVPWAQERWRAWRPVLPAALLGLRWAKAALNETLALIATRTHRVRPDRAKPRPPRHKPHRHAAYKAC
ncbi:hypothetical protein CBM2634_U130007 [Cupriavidus taiwanensis]|uniref:Transposase IS4-like domain-containing protein n=1 Tax=Cupriavidus taiwanensis TaxID=164546 RepID=A0A375JFX8_9BURK|nr:hypothetical protein CBM2634_U130007 [Cupriavidus taiwanensis]